MEFHISVRGDFAESEQFLLRDPNLPLSTHTSRANQRRKDSQKNRTFPTAKEDFWPADQHHNRQQPSNKQQHPTNNLR
jgi:hypothetical protein